MITVENGKIQILTKKKKIKCLLLHSPETTTINTDKICLFPSLLSLILLFLLSPPFSSLPFLPSFHLSDKFYHRHPWRFCGLAPDNYNKAIITIKQVQDFLVSPCM